MPAQFTKVENLWLCYLSLQRIRCAALPKPTMSVMQSGTSCSVAAMNGGLIKQILHALPSYSHGVQEVNSYVKPSIPL